MLVDDRLQQRMAAIQVARPQVGHASQHQQQVARLLQRVVFLLGGKLRQRQHLVARARQCLHTLVLRLDQQQHDQRRRNNPDQRQDACP